MNKKGVNNTAFAVGIFAVMIPIILIAIFSGPIINMINNADDQYTCSDPANSIVCDDKSFCTNSTEVCANPPYPILNLTYHLCTNTSGVRIINESPSAPCSVEGWRSAATDIGLNSVEATLLRLIPIFLIIGYIVFLVAKAGIKKD